MTGKRQLASRILCRSGAVRVVGALRRAFSTTVPILAYHRVLDAGNEDDYPFDIELVSASVAGFERQMQHLATHHRPTTFARLLECLDRGEAPAPGTVVVTFDDGFLDNYENAFPVLRRLGVPAVVFLSTGYIDGQGTYWYERLAHAVMTAAPGAVRWDGEPPMALGETPSSRREALKRMLRRLKRMPNAERLSALDEWLRQLGAPAGDEPDPRSRPMTWEQAREMARNGIEFGSHTVTHPVLSSLTPAELDWEVRHSRSRIEQELATVVTAISYPVGGPEAFNAQVREAVRAAGYRLALSYIPGAQAPPRWDRLAVPRLHVERYTDEDSFRAMLAAPRAFA